MVDDLFELARINADALDLDFDEVSIGDVLSDAVATAQPVAVAKGVAVQGTPPGQLPPVHGSVPELGRVLRNLLANAVRYTPAGGAVSVTAAADAGEVLVEVRNSCGGIPEGDLPRLFDVAFRGTAARTPDEDGGAGLGLAIVRGLVEAHGGTIAISNQGAGCCARVRLPATVTGSDTPPPPRVAP